MISNRDAQSCIPVFAFINEVFEKNDKYIVTGSTFLRISFRNQ